MVLSSEENLEEKEFQAQPLEKSTLKSEFFRLFVDEFYILTGVGAAILVLVIYLRKR
jgi:GTPase